MKSDETNGQARSTEVETLLKMGWRKIAIIEQVWGVKPGAPQGYRDASAEYESIVQTLAERRA